jgi:hypothetical protein
MPVIEVPGIGNVHFPDGMKDAEMATAIDGLLAQQTQAGGQLPTTPSHNPAQALPIPTSAPAPTAAPARKPVTASQQLQEDNGSLSRGFGTLVEEGLGGVTEAASGGALGKIMGLLRLAGAPGTAAGSAVGTTVHDGLANLTQGLPGGGAEGVIPAAGAAIADAGTQVLGLRGLVSGTKTAIQGAASVLDPGVLRRAGGELISSKMGAPKTVLERAFTTPASKAAYNLADQSGPVRNMPDLASTVQEAFFQHGSLANPSKAALEHLSKLEKKFSGATRGMPYSEVMREIQALKHKADDALRGATPDGDLAKTLLDARELLIEELDKVSNLYRQANRLYRQEQAVIDVMNEVRKGTPGTALERFIENNRDVAQAFKPEVIKEISDIAHKLNDVASATPASGFRQWFSAGTKMLQINRMMASPVGRGILRESLNTTNDKIPAALGAAMQLWKARSTSEY